MKSIDLLRHPFFLEKSSRTRFRIPRVCRLEKSQQMNGMKRGLISIALLLLTSMLNASEEDFSKDALFFPSGNISVVSPFDTTTFITTYSSTGEPLWEVAFTSEIISWKQKENQLLVFSKARNDAVYFLTCIDAAEGTFVWERRILAPEPEPSSIGASS